MRYLLITISLFLGVCFISTTAFAQQTKFSNLTEKNGKIGIGTKKPDALLTVRGDIHAQEVRVDLQGAVAPDYVFEKYFLGYSKANPSYRLWSLKETERYLSTHFHLPGMPSAEAMQEEGIDLVKQNLILLEKIEELTLYLIEQQKEIDGLKQDLKELTN